NRKENNKIFDNKKPKIDEDDNIDKSINDMEYKYNKTNFEDFKLLLKQENFLTLYDLKSFLTKNINNIESLRINIEDDNYYNDYYEANPDHTIKLKQEEDDDIVSNSKKYLFHYFIEKKYITFMFTENQNFTKLEMYDMKNPILISELNSLGLIKNFIS
ncbi:11179_t:CDS:2, partial [Dentiscutata erythropus]